jgi:hypothetical protein
MPVISRLQIAEFLPAIHEANFLALSPIWSHSQMQLAGPFFKLPFKYCGELIEILHPPRQRIATYGRVKAEREGLFWVIPNDIRPMKGRLGVVAASSIL